MSSKRAITGADVADEIKRAIVLVAQERRRQADAEGDTTRAAVETAYVRAIQGLPRQPQLVELIRLLQSDDFAARAGVSSLRPQLDARAVFADACVKHAVAGEVFFFEELLHAVRCCADLQTCHPHQLTVAMAFDRLRKALRRNPTATELLTNITAEDPGLKLDARTLRFICAELELPLAKAKSGRPKR